MRLQVGRTVLRKAHCHAMVHDGFATATSQPSPLVSISALEMQRCDPLSSSSDLVRRDGQQAADGAQHRICTLVQHHLPRLGDEGVSPIVKVLGCGIHSRMLLRQEVPASNGQDDEVEERAEMIIADPSWSLESKSERLLLDHFRPLEVYEGALDDKIVVEVLEGEWEV